MQTPMIKILVGLFACLAIVAAAPVVAEEEDDHRLDDAWQHAIGDQEPVLTEKQFALLNNLAFQVAATKVCDGFTLDGEKFSVGFTEATSPLPPNLTDEDVTHWKKAVLIRFGTSYGILLAEGNAEEAAFCENAEEMKADAEVPHVWQ